MALANAFALIFSLIFGIHSSATISTNVEAPTVTATFDASQVETLAKCLTKKNAIMYGAYWCPHCQKQRALFGDAFQYVKYQECDPKGENSNPKACETAGILNYPTWEIPGHAKMEGEQTLEDLAKASSCQI